MLLRVAWGAARRWLWFVVPLALLAIALFLPVSGAAGVAFLGLLALAGAGVALALARWRIALPRWAQDLIVVSVVSFASVQLFAGPWQVGGFKIWDWGP